MLNARLGSARGLAALAGALLWPGRSARGPAGAALRARFGGDYLELPGGTVRYRLRGAAADPLVLMIGGLTTTMDYFDGAAAALLAHRYRTLQFDLYGRGGSARPRALAYDRAAYCGQIDAMIDALRVDEPLFVIGQSLGGALAASYAALRPARVWALSLHASAGFLARPPPSLRLVRTPLLGPLVWRCFGLRSTLAGVERHFYDPAAHQHDAARLRQCIRDSAAFAGYGRAVLKTLQRVRVEDLEADFRALGRLGVPVQLVWGRADAIIPVDHALVLADWLGGHTQIATFGEVGHLPLLEAPELVLPEVLAFFDARRAAPV